MKLIIHDLSPEVAAQWLPRKQDAVVITDDGSIRHCVGCFGCWLKTPGACVIRDRYQDIGELLSKCDELLLVSRCVYGGFSNFVKNVLDRSISYVHPYFAYRNGEMHHRMRYNHRFNLSVRFYGEELTRQEKETAKGIVQAYALNMDCMIRSISFINEDVGGETPC